ncbi:MAG: hypothetical protein GY938_02995 [Ketobacter sp.]|nr:hypothetical protein [Ketobacter sp.]
MIAVGLQHAEVSGVVQAAGAACSFRIHVLEEEALVDIRRVVVRESSERVEVGAGSVAHQIAVTDRVEPVPFLAHVAVRGAVGGKAVGVSILAALAEVDSGVGSKEAVDETGVAGRTVVEPGLGDVQVAIGNGRALSDQTVVGEGSGVAGLAGCAIHRRKGGVLELLLGVHDHHSKAAVLDPSARPLRGGERSRVGRQAAVHISVGSGGLGGNLRVEVVRQELSRVREEDEGDFRGGVATMAGVNFRNGEAPEAL